MYSRFAEERGWKIGLIDASASEVGGYKEVVFSVTGKDVYAHLQYESGGHRVQRVPATESSGRIHTSAATVAVFPEAEPQDNLTIPADDLKALIERSYSTFTHPETVPIVKVGEFHIMELVFLLRFVFCGSAVQAGYAYVLV